MLNFDIFPHCRKYLDWCSIRYTKVSLAEKYILEQVKESVGDYVKLAAVDIDGVRKTNWLSSNTHFNYSSRQEFPPFLRICSTDLIVLSFFYFPKFELISEISWSTFSHSHSLQIPRGKYISKDKFFSAVKGGSSFCSVVFGWDVGGKKVNEINSRQLCFQISRPS